MIIGLVLATVFASALGERTGLPWSALLTIVVCPVSRHRRGKARTERRYNPAYVDAVLAELDVMVFAAERDALAPPRRSR